MTYLRLVIKGLYVLSYSQQIFTAMSKKSVTELLNSNVVLTTSEAARVLNISIPTITRWKRDEKIPFIQINGSIRYKSEDLKAMLNL